MVVLVILSKLGRSRKRSVVATSKRTMRLQTEVKIYGCHKNRLYLKVIEGKDQVRRSGSKPIRAGDAGPTEPPSRHSGLVEIERVCEEKSIRMNQFTQKSTGLSHV
jgi:hypothetical protein